jgi:thiol:disulfide interchange protein
VGTNRERAAAGRIIMQIRRNWIAGALAAVWSLMWCSTSAQAQPGQKVAVSAVTSREVVRPGDQFAIAVIFDHQPGWHVHTNDPKPPKEWDFEAIPTAITPPESSGLTFGPIQWPEAHEVKIDLGGTGTPLPYEVFEGKAIAFVPVIAGAALPLGEAKVSLKVSYQACDDRQCGMPMSVTLDVPMRVVPISDTTTSSTAPDPAIFGGFRSSVFSDMLSGKVVAADAKPVELNFFGRTISLDTENPIFLVMLLFFAGLGGFLLNLTPCVVPVIPIKIMSLSAAAGNPARCFYLGVVTSLGVIAFWSAIGIAIAFVAGFKQVNQLFQLPAFTMGIGLFVAIMALGMLGLFTVAVPSWVYKYMPASVGDAGSGGSTWSTFLFGVFTAILSTPCTAPFMGGAMAWGAKQPSAVTITTFTAIGVGMALPYAILAAFPKWISKVPRSGAAANLVKQTIGMLMLAVAVFFIGTGLDPMVRLPIDPPVRFYWWVIAGFIVLSMAWLVWNAFKITSSAAKRGVWVSLAALLSAAGVWMAVHFTDRGPINWIAYTPERFEEARREGKVVVMDFTAEWCLNCKALEASVLHRDNVAALLGEPGVVPMKVDLTGNNSAGQEKLDSLQWLGIPLLAIFGPGLSEPLKYDTYTPDVVIKAVEQARQKVGMSGGVR